jgi:hypothetical protein
MASGHIRGHISADRDGIHDFRIQDTALFLHYFAQVLAGVGLAIFADSG